MRASSPGLRRLFLAGAIALALALPQAGWAQHRGGHSSHGSSGHTSHGSAGHSSRGSGGHSSHGNAGHSSRGRGGYSLHGNTGHSSHGSSGQRHRSHFGHRSSHHSRGGSLYGYYGAPYGYYGSRYGYPGYYDSYGYYGAHGAPYRGGSSYSGDRSEGAFDLDVQPGRAQVFLDGQYIGTTDDFDGYPQYLWLDRGSYDLVLYSEGYITLSRRVTALPGVVVRFDEEMVRGASVRPESLAPGQGSPRAGLHLTVLPEDSSVYLDGRFLGTARELGDVAGGVQAEPGLHRLEVVRPGYQAESRTFTAAAGGAAELRIELRKD